MSDCEHKPGQVKFFALTAADRYPGEWVCDCGKRWSFDPNNPHPKGIRYLDGPKNPKPGPKLAQSHN